MVLSYLSTDRIYQIIRSLLVVAILSLGLHATTVSAQCCVAVQAFIVTLDGNSTATGRSSSAAATLPAVINWSNDGNTHVFYCGSALRHAYAPTSSAATATWQFENLDSISSPCDATDPQAQLPGASVAVGSFFNQIHVFNWEYDGAGRVHLAHYWKGVGQSWGHEVLDGDGCVPNCGGGTGRINTPLGGSIAVTSRSGQLDVFYGTNRITGTGVLRHAWQTGGSWSFETLDGSGCTYSGCLTAGYGGLQRQIAATTDGNNVHVFYTEDTSGTALYMRDVYWNGSSWSYAIADTLAYPNNGSGIFVQNGIPSIAYYSDGLVHAFYSGAGTVNGFLQKTWTSSSGWSSTSSTIVSGQVDGLFTSAYTNPTGGLQVAYQSGGYFGTIRSVSYTVSGGWKGPSQYDGSGTDLTYSPNAQTSNNGGSNGVSAIVITQVNPQTHNPYTLYFYANGGLDLRMAYF